MNREHTYKDKDKYKDKYAERIAESLTVCYIFGILMTQAFHPPSCSFLVHASFVGIHCHSIADKCRREINFITLAISDSYFVAFYSFGFCIGI